MLRLTLSFAARRGPAEQLARWGATVEVLEPDTVKTELARLGAELVQY